MISGLRYGVTVRTLSSGKWTKSIETNDATSVRARHGVLLLEPGHGVGIQPDIAKPSQGPAPLWSQDTGRRLLPGQSGAGQGALPLPRWQIDRSEDPGWSCTYRRGPAPAVTTLSREGSES
jgi:hypothetical protein